MDISGELARLVPRWDASPTRADSDKFVQFLVGLGRKDYEQVIGQLPARLTHHREAIINDEAAWYEYVQVVCFQTIVNYDRHVPGDKIISLLGNTSGIGRDLASLALMLSEANRKRIPYELLSREVIETQRLLEAHFKGARVGIVDYAVELMVDRLFGDLGRKQAQIVAGLRRPGDNQFNKNQAHEYKLLRAIQALRRRNPTRLPGKPGTAEEIRFLAEETGRLLFGYESKDPKAAIELIDRIWSWYGSSELYRSTRSNVAIYLVETGFFANLKELRSKVSAGATYEPHWNYYIKVPLRSEKFWDDIAGLNHDIPIESTEAGRRQQTYQRAAVVGGLLFAGMLALPIVIQVAWAAPGAAIRLVSWTGRTLWLASRYVYTSIRVYGLFGGSAKMARDGFEYYMQNAVVINQRIMDVTELVLDVFTEGTGAAPGGSLADQTRHATEKLAVLAEKGVKSLVDDAGKLLKEPGKEIEFVKLLVKDADGKEFEVIGRVARTEAQGLKLVDLQKTEIAAAKLDDEARKTITFIGQPTKDAPAVPDLRGTLDTGAAGKAGAGSAKTEATAARSAANENRATKASDQLDDLSRQRQKAAAEKERIAQKQAEDMAQKQELATLGERKAVGGGGATETQMGRGTGVDIKGADVGKVSPAEGGRASGSKARGAGKSDAPLDKGKADRGKGGGASSVPAQETPALRAVTKSPAGYLIVVDEAALKVLKDAGYKVTKIPVKVPKSGGARFQVLGVTGVEHEWRLTSQTRLKDGSLLQADIDGLALDPHAPGSFIFLEAKATFVEDVGRSAHVRFYPDKVEQLGRQLMICLESKGKLRMEIVTNATQAAEAYMNMTVQQVANDIRKRFAGPLREYLSTLKGSPVSRLSLAEVERIVEDNVNIVVVKWGTLSKTP